MSASNSDDALFKRWNSLWLKANEEASAEMFNQATLPQNHQAVLQSKALRKTIIAFAAAVSERGTSDRAQPAEEAPQSEAEHLRMQIGYIVTELMVRGDPRSLPEIVETAAKATALRPGPEGKRDGS